MHAAKSRSKPARVPCSRSTVNRKANTLRRTNTFGVLRPSVGRSAARQARPGI